MPENPFTVDARSPDLASSNSVVRKVYLPPDGSVPARPYAPRILSSATLGMICGTRYDNANFG